jgi:adenosylmethionine-8-amino-7-oxononanoate aminotransferase
MPPPTHQQLIEWDRQHVWHAFTQMAEYDPLIFESGQGCTLTDIHGRQYLDGVSSLWCNVHGHRHPRIDAAIREQLERLAHATLLGASNPAAILLARRLAEIAPGDLQHVFFSGDGSSAVEVGLKLAFQFWRQCDVTGPKNRHEKTKYVAFTEAYHGDTLGSVSVGGVARFHAMFQPLLFDVLRAAVPNPRALPDGVPQDQAAGFYLDGLERILSRHHEQIAAIIIEPLVQCAAGMIMHPAGFLKGVRELSTQYDVLLIADEVATGFGRTGTMFACDQEAVVPDILCLGKGITGGYLPLAATIASPRIWQAFLGDYAELKTFFHGHTYSGNPLAAAAALASLDIFDEENTLRALEPKISRLAAHLSRLADHPHVADVRQTGLIAGIELVQDKASRQPYPWQTRTGWKVCQAALAEGVWIRPLGDVLVVMPPLAISIAEIDRILEVIALGIDSVINAKV